MPEVELGVSEYVNQLQEKAKEFGAKREAMVAELGIEEDDEVTEDDSGS